MWVYLYQNNSELAMKNAYIGEVYEYSYTFKWKTATEIWNDWALSVWTIQTNSDWVCWSSNTDCNIKVDIPSLATAKKITISWTVVVNNAPYTAASIGIWAGSWWGTSLARYDIEWSVYDGLVISYYDGSFHLGNKVGNASVGTFNPTLTIDLVNKTMVWTLSWFSNSTLTLTDAYINNIRQMTYLLAYVSVNTSALSDISITIEY
jgi:hypothetical protein